MPKKSESKMDKKAESFIVGMAVVGLVLYTLAPQSWSADVKGAIFLLCLAVGYLGAYHPERTKQVWDLVWLLLVAYMLRIVFFADVKRMMASYSKQKMTD